MRPARRIEVDVEELVLEGLQPGEAALAAEALRFELARLLVRRGLPAPGRRPARAGFRGLPSPGALGAALAVAVYEELSR